MCLAALLIGAEHLVRSEESSASNESANTDRGHISQEELRALRTAVQLMVKRSEEKSAAQSSLQPSTSVMEPIQEGGSEADGSGSSPAEEATPEDDPPRASEPHSPAKASPRCILFLWCHALGKASLGSVIVVLQKGFRAAHLSHACDPGTKHSSGMSVPATEPGYRM